jgi:FolB domain-containing protein
MAEFPESPKWVELTINRLRCQVRLGWEADERRVSQWVAFDVEVRFPSLPSGCRTDELGEVICYDQVSGWIQNLCREGEFRLVEKLCLQAYEMIRGRLAPGCQLRIRVTKESPPIHGLQGGASFGIGDWV